MPTALPTPWPSGPVVVSTPLVWCDLGVARGQRAPGAQRLEVGQLQAVAGEVELDVEGEARVAHREHEPVAAHPVRVARVVPEPLLEQQVGGGGHAHRGAGMAVADLLDGVHGQDARGVDRAAVEIAEALGQGRARLRGAARGESVAASAGASAAVLCGSHVVGAPSEIGRAARAAGPAGDRHSGPGRTVLVDGGTTRCTRSINVIDPSRPARAAPTEPGRGLQWPRSHPRSEGTTPGAPLPARLAHEGTR